VETLVAADYLRLSRALNVCHPSDLARRLPDFVAAKKPALPEGFCAFIPSFSAI
jgi:hypothetical protein